VGVHDNFVDLAERLISKNGRDITLSLTTTTPDAQPWKVGSTSVATQVVKAVFDGDLGDPFAAILTQTAGSGDRETTTLNARESLVLIAAKGLTIVPTPDVQMIDGDQTLEIVSVIPIKPGAQDIMYTVKVKH
jgi:hypothetical protein